MLVNVWAEACFDERYRCAYMLVWAVVHMFKNTVYF